MVFNCHNRNPSIAERQFSVSEWNDAPIEQVTGSAHPSSPSMEVIAQFRYFYAC